MCSLARGTGPWRENDATAPVNVYGAMTVGRPVLASGADALILRTSWVYSGPGRTFGNAMPRLARRERLTVVDDQIGAPTASRFCRRHPGRVGARLARPRRALYLPPAPAAPQLVRHALSNRRWPTAQTEAGKRRRRPIPSSSYHSAPPGIPVGLLGV